MRFYVSSLGNYLAVKYTFENIKDNDTFLNFKKAFCKQERLKQSNDKVSLVIDGLPLT